MGVEGVSKGNDRKQIIRATQPFDFTQDRRVAPTIYYLPIIVNPLLTLRYNFHLAVHISQDAWFVEILSVDEDRRPS